MRALLYSLFLVNKAITGADMQSVLTSVGSEIKKKQDIVDAEFDNANNMLVLNNVEIDIAASGT